MMEFDDATVRGELPDSEWREIQEIVQKSFVMLARSLGDRTTLGKLLRDELVKNPLFPKLSEPQRFRLWEYCNCLFDFAYRCPDDSGS